MPNWTLMQQKAIKESGKNIVVSAGAGSGKTAVLTERVITKLRNGVNIQNLLILTFTNAAAMEMKDRIRKALQNDINLKEQLELLDSSYITTFDSFAMTIVKKYHYLLNISNNLKIIDKVVCDNIRLSLLEDIFESLYETKDPDFLKMIDDLTIKDDTQLKKEIIKLNELLDRLIDKRGYLNNYIDDYYNDDKYKFYVDNYIKLLNNKLSKIDILFNDLTMEAPNEYCDKISSLMLPLLKSGNYNDIKKNINFKIPPLPKNSSDELKTTKDYLSEAKKDLESLLIYKDENHLITTLKSSKPYVNVIIKVVKLLDDKLNNYKFKYDRFEFNDIAKMVIELVEKNEQIRKNLTNSFTEIMVDEYQDTSDIQEKLISLISNNNLYLVGDIKQSIYRFRNANPDIFKEKYENYANENGGIKIDLLDNFRSRKEVINNINSIFNILMTNEYGGAEYQKSHQMIFGNLTYDENSSNVNYNFEINTYNQDNLLYSESEYEAFIIAYDIKDKIKKKYQVYDNNLKKLRPCDYHDFCILIDRKNSFELYKKIFEYLAVPLTIYFDETITQEKDILILKNIIDLIIKIYKKEFDTKFKYDMYSVMRSYINKCSDEEYLKYIINNNFEESTIYQKCFQIAQNLEVYSPKTLTEEIIDKFNFYEQTFLVGDIQNSMIRLDYLVMLAEDLTLMDYSVFGYNDYLNNMILNNNDISFSSNVSNTNNVKLMNIHKSKGLEFNICYYTGFDKEFNRKDLSTMLNFDREYGIIAPFYDEGIGPTICKILFKEKYKKEDISERIRLFYVALTRAKEKIIFVMPNKESKILSKDDYSSFLTFINSIKNHFKDKIIIKENINLSKNYLLLGSPNVGIKDSEKVVNVKEVKVDTEIIKSSKVSKNVTKLLSQKERDILEIGTKTHELFEFEDFNNPQSDYVKKLINHLGNIKNAKVYKEYEFNTIIDNTNYNGIIDLMIEYDDHIKIVDYKLANIDDEAYVKQLGIYKKYVESKSNKKVLTYLYSIMNDEFKAL